MSRKKSAVKTTVKNSSHVTLACYRPYGVCQNDELQNILISFFY
ncbi:hypothetical protein YPD27_1883 [Yersinia pestis KIM D27]|nr:hypothetical protein YPD27_1883 [Yersinia pestis KIM D27]